MAYLELKDVKRKYKEFELDLSFSIEEGELLSIIGPSGSGKSTALSIIAGIEKLDSGNIFLEGEDITNLEIQKRNIGMVFQDYALFPSMNVEKNIQYGMKNKDKKSKKEFTSSILKLVGLEGYEKRSVNKLSGGEAQRVALARAIAAEPKILLLDEPLSALDAPLRKRLRSVIRSVQEMMGITMIYVTHDREEAFAISDRILIMNDGKSVEIGTAEDLYSKPQSLFTAFFTGDGTALPASLIYENKSGYIFFRPENVTISEEAIDPNLYTSHIVLNNVDVLSSEFNGSGYTLGLEFQGNPILATSILKPRKKLIAAMILESSLKFLEK